MQQLKWAWALLLLLGVASLGWAENCRGFKVNTQNARACKTVSTSAVTIAAPNTGRCSLAVYNKSTNGVFCTDVTKEAAPTDTTGFPVDGGGVWSLGSESQGQIQCILQSTATGDATLCTVEGLP
jgi:hypothetical protein